ncbi:MAG: Lantibiotic dehydratase domain protein, partial [Segetibacter sp.]|nr:Lantibiotic dehydratase domain protein [Segetibacter sp.]
MKSEFDFLPFIVVRTPAFSIENLIEETFQSYQSDGYFREALYIASPELALNVGQNFSGNEDIKLSLAKYFNRMCFRCTPFGLFAACSIANWGSESKIILSKDNILRRTRLDKDFLEKITNKINSLKFVFRHLKVSVNNTLYPVGSDLRFIEKDEGNQFNVVSIESNEILNFFIESSRRENTDINELTERAKKKGISEKQSIAYLRQLVDNQILIPHTKSSATSDVLLKYLIDFLTDISVKPHGAQAVYWKNLLTDLQLALNAIDEKLIGNEDGYNKIISVLNRLGISQPHNRLIQVDSVYDAPAGTVNNRIKKDLQKGSEILKLISTNESENTVFEKFKKNFFEKYEYREIPLLIALDPEFGIDYLEGASNFDNFLSEIFMGRQFNPAGQGQASMNLKMLIQKIENAHIHGKKNIEIEESDLNQMEFPNVNLSLSHSVFFRIFGDDQIQIDHIGGSSGINLFTRFTDFDKKLFDIAKKVTKLEEDKTNDSILAEVIHEPEPRAANVNVFPNLRQFVIPYFSEVLNNEAIQIPLRDLALSIDKGKFVLRSISLNRFIIPKISSAYNFSKGSPIFRFLGDLQNQGYQSLKLDMLKLLPGSVFYPRVSYKKIIFSPAMWKIEFNDILKFAPSLSNTEIQTFLLTKGITRHFIISEGDNELLIDQRQENSLAIFTAIIRKTKSVLIKEFLFDPLKHPVSNDSGKLLNDQMIAILFSKDTNRYPVKPPNQVPKNIQRKFSLGSEWVYYKLYCGVVSADKILVNQVFPLIQKLKKEGVIKNAFFIRYADPDLHLRLRFQVTKKESLEDVINVTRHMFSKSEQLELIWKIQTETY